MLSFKPTFSLSSFTFIKMLFSSSLLSAIKFVSSVYLRLLIFLPAILISACASSSLAFHMRYSAYKLNKQGDNIQPWRTPFPIWNQSVVPRPVLTVASWPAYRFLKSQVRWSGIPISLRITSAHTSMHELGHETRVRTTIRSHLVWYRSFCLHCTSFTSNCVVLKLCRCLIVNQCFMSLYDNIIRNHTTLSFRHSLRI